MEHTVTIKQIITREWTTSDGRKGVEIVGLGDDNMVYEWHRGTGRWVLSIMKSN